MSKHFEIVIFTAAMQDYADWVLDQLDTGPWITHRLYRQHTRKENHVYCKDLSLLGRSLATTVIVDNVAQNFSKQP
jgi:CTD small phosphatase-like protein 2